jgi:D-lyxose ketol-isomerase
MSMKRSFVNDAIKKAIAICEEYNVKLPPFAYWSPTVWRTKNSEADEIRDLRLGWDVTDFGLGDFKTTGRTLFTLRNGSYKLAAKYERAYSEKFIFIEEEQAAPVHFHRRKMEDIICRFGGNIIVQLYKADQDGRISQDSFDMSLNGCRTRFAPGQMCRLTPGQSVFIPPGIIHKFWSEKGTGLTVSGEIGSICDDINDNVFLTPCSRFADIEADQEPAYLLCNEYDTQL